MEYPRLRRLDGDLPDRPKSFPKEAMMKTIYADYNASTEAGHICLTCLGSEEDLRRTELGVGDWAWLSDGEIIVGARLEMDSYYGLVGVPDWETIVHLDDEGDRDPARLSAELMQLSQQHERSAEDEARIFQIMVLLETFAPPAEIEAVKPSYFALRRAGALRAMGKLELALVEAEEAVRQAPDDPNTKWFYLNFLENTDLPRAILEAKAEAERDCVSAMVLAACINIWAIGSERVSDGQFQAIAGNILDWANRFEQAPGRQSVADSVAALVDFNRGMTLLRLARPEEARQWLGRAGRFQPFNQMIGDATRLDKYDRHARAIASRVHAERLQPAA